MGNAFDDLAEIQDVARTIRARADLVHDVVTQARAAFERTVYECGAAHRQQMEMTRIAGRTHTHGDALTQLAADLLRRAAALGSGTP